MNDFISLCDMQPGETARIKNLLATGSIRQRFLDLGIIPATPVTCIGKSPLGDPIAFSIRGTILAIRKKDCKRIFIEPKKG